jgi:hypothetical protein
MAAPDSVVLRKRRSHEAQSCDTVQVLQDLEKRAAAPRYKFYRRRLPDVWNIAHPNFRYPTVEALLEHEHDACIPFFVQHVLDGHMTAETRKSYLNALKQLGRDQLSADGLRTLDAQIRDFRVQIKDLETRNECNDTDDAHWIPWTEVTKLFDQFTIRMYEQCQEDPYDVWQCYLLFALYCLQPPLRNNYSCVFMTPPKMPLELLDLTSYVDLSVPEPFIHIGHDKVSHIYGTCNIPLDPALVIVIQGLEKKFGPRKYLLTLNTCPRLPLEESNIRTQKTNTARLWTRLSELVGHPLNVCMLRSSYATWFLGLPNIPESDVIKAAGCMRTSTDTLRVNYRKVKGPTAPTPPPTPDAAAVALFDPSSLSDF